MSETQDLKPHGVPRPKGTAWLKKVKLDAAQAAINHVTRQLEKKEQEAQKQRGITVEEMTENAKRRLSGMESFEARVTDEPDDFDDDVTFEDEDELDEGDDQGQTEEPEQATPISRMNKTELHALAAEMELEVPEGMSNAELRQFIKSKQG